MLNLRLEDGFGVAGLICLAVWNVVSFGEGDFICLIMALVLSTVGIGL